MQEANSSDREKLERARRELASVAKIKQVFFTVDLDRQGFQQNLN